MHSSPLTLGEKFQQLVLAPVNGIYGLRNAEIDAVDTTTVGRMFGQIGVIVFIMSIGAFISFASFILFLCIVFYTLFAGRRVTENNYWNEYADTLEWTLPCPPPEHTFEQLPKQSDWDKGHAH